MAGAVGVDADAHPIERDEHCAGSNQLVSTILAGVFLPVVSKYGYSTIFFLFAGFTVFYLLTVIFFLPETKGKTLEEIEEYFEGPKRGASMAG